MQRGRLVGTSQRTHGPHCLSDFDAELKSNAGIVTSHAERETVWDGMKEPLCFNIFFDTELKSFMICDVDIRKELYIMSISEVARPFSKGSGST